MVALAGDSYPGSILGMAKTLICCSIPIDDAEFIGVASPEELARNAQVAAEPSEPRRGNGGGGGGGRRGGAPEGARRKELDAPAGACAADEPSEGVSPDPEFDLEKELEGVVGLEEVKEMLRSLRNAVEVRKRRSEFGVKDERTMHMLFLGNPGTGKTTVARLVAQMLASLGVLKKGQLIEVTRKDLIGSHHGETAQLTAAAVTKALGGVLFIDEAYALRHEGSSDSAGQARASPVLCCTVWGRAPPVPDSCPPLLIRVHPS